MTMFRCGDKAPDDTYTMLECISCGGTFPHKGRGRKPTMCPWARENAPTKQSARVAVPTFVEIEGFSGIKPGDILYRLPDFDDEVVRRRFSFEYEVLRITEDSVTVVRNLKAGYKNHPATLDSPKGLYRKTGTEYIDKEEEEVIDDDD